ncbi:MAG TPA: glucosyltransferase domain-containing protein [Gammaproteobacteria bacterium]
MTTRTRICLGLLVLVPLAVYWQTIFHEYGFRDDYAHLREVHEEPGKLTRFTASNGRPLYGALIELTLRPFHEVQDLVWLRLLGTVLLIGAGLLSYRLLARSGWPPLHAAAVGLSIVLLPAAQMTVGWAISWPNAFALLLGAIGFIAAESGLSRHGLGRVAGVLAGGGCYALAALTYQSNALFAVALLAGVLLVRRGSLAADARWAAAHLGTLFGGLFAAFVVMEALFAAGVYEESSRIRFETHPLRKLGWFFEQPLANALALFSLRDTFGTGAVWFWTAVAVVGALLVLGALAAGRSGGRAQWGRWLFCLAALPFAAHAVSLAAGERTSAYRTIFALASLVVVLAVGSLRRVVAWRRAPRAAEAVLLAASLAAAAVLANRHAFLLIAQPQGREWAMVRDAVRRMRLDADTTVHIVTPTLQHRSTMRVFADEFGSLSSNSDWVPAEMFKTALRERFPKALPPGCSYRLTFGPERPLAHFDLVIDMRALARFRH